MIHSFLTTILTHVSSLMVQQAVSKSQLSSFISSFLPFNIIVFILDLNVLTTAHDIKSHNNKNGTSAFDVDTHFFPSFL